MSLSIAIYTFIPPIADLATDTHVFHQEWLPHARMHTVWLLGVTSGIGMVSLYFLWFSDSDAKFRINLSGVLSTVVFLAFYLSASTISLYGGSLSDMPADVHKGPFGINGNLFAFTLASVVLMLGWFLSARSRT